MKRNSISHLLTFFCLMLFSNMVSAQCAGVVEICDNGIDDDCDGLIDCFDPDCYNSKPCEDFYYGQPEPPCMEVPEVEYKFNLVEQWASSVQVEARVTTVIGDLDGDGFPEVVTSHAGAKTVYILDGRDGTVKYTINAEINMYQHSAGLADVDRDGFGEVFLVDKDRYLRCFNHDGTVKAGFTPTIIGTGTDNASYESSPHPAFVDFDGDGNVEIYMGAQIFDAATGTLIAQAASLATASKGAVGATSSQHRFPVAYDVLPDAYCADCNGAELIAGNTVYSVNVAAGTLTIASTFSEPAWAQGGATAIADWNGDGQMDVIVSGIHGGGAVYIWDPRTTKLITTDAGGNPLVTNPYKLITSTGSNAYGGLPSIADFDGDGLLEFAMVSTNSFFMVQNNLTAGWNNVVFDASSVTTSTSFDFEGDGKMEVVYRDERNLYVLDGVTGTIRAQVPCGSGTRVETPVVADVDADGEAEIICTCGATLANQGVVKVFESNINDWMPARKVWNTLNYYPVSINDDLTIPRQFQNKALIPGQDIYLAQANIISDRGNIIHQALPDLVATVENTYIPSGDCDSPTAKADIQICNEDFRAHVFDFDISYYNGDPITGGILIGSKKVTAFDVKLVSSTCMTLTLDVPIGDYDLHLYVNDRGGIPLAAPDTMMAECDITNNLAIGKISSCASSKVDTFQICQGATEIIVLRGDKKGEVFGTEPFTKVNDSTYVVEPTVTTTYYTTKNIKVKPLVINPDFENPVIAATNFSIINAGAVPGWQTDAPDNNMEIWSTGFLGVPSYSGNQFIELAAHYPSTVYQDIPTTPGAALQWEFAHRGRLMAETMRLEVGPPGGPYINLGDFTDGTAAWGFYMGNYVVPVGQVSTRFRFKYVAGISSASGNFIDAVNFYTVVEKLDSFVVLVNDTPKVDLGPAIEICEGNKATLDAKNIGFQYLWSTGENTQTIEVMKEGEYIVEVFNDKGCARKDTIEITFKVCAVGKHEVIEICEGDNELLIMKGNPAGIFYGVEMFVQITDSTYQVSPLKNTSYYFTGAVTDTFEVIVHPKPKVNLGPDQMICDGDSVIIDAGNLGMTYSWNSVEVTQKIVAKTTGPYEVEVKSDKGCVARDTIEIVVNSNPLVSLGPDAIFCEGDSVVFDAANVGSAYQWNTGEVTQKSTVNTTGSYDVLVTDANGCVGKDTADVLVKSSPIIDLGNDVNICNGDSVILDASYAGANYLWNTGEVTSTIKIKTSGTFDVILTGANGCKYHDTINVKVNPNPIVDLGLDKSICAGDSILLDAANVGATYLWNSGALSQKQNLKVTGTFDVIVTDANGCVGKDTVEVVSNPLPLVNLGNDTIVCEGNSISIKAGNIGDTYLWSTGQTDEKIEVALAGDYWVKVTDADGCSQTDTMNLTVNIIPTVELGNDVILCSGESFALNAQNKGLNVLWNTGATSQMIIVDQAGKYKVTVSDPIACAASDSIEVTVNTISDPFREKEFTICEGTNILLRPDAGFEQYQTTWLSGTKEIDLNASESGTYYNVVSDGVCSDTFLIIVQVIDTPMVKLVDLGGQDDYCFKTESTFITLENLDKQSSFLHSSWGVEQTIQVTEPGVQKIIVSNESCSSTAYIEIMDYCPPIVYVPNAFSPNTTGANEVFLPIVNGQISDYEMQIFNRWGDQIYTSKNIDKGWDGKVNGKEVQIDVYVYRINYSYLSAIGGDENEQLVGIVTLIR